MNTLIPGAPLRSLSPTTNEYQRAQGESRAAKPARAARFTLDAPEHSGTIPGARGDILTPGVALTSNLAVIFTLNQHSTSSQATPSEAWWRTRSIVTRRSSGRRCGLERWRGNELNTELGARYSTRWLRSGCAIRTAPGDSATGTGRSAICSGPCNNAPDDGPGDRRLPESSLVRTDE